MTGDELLTMISTARYPLIEEIESVKATPLKGSLNARVIQQAEDDNEVIHEANMPSRHNHISD